MNIVDTFDDEKWEELRRRLLPFSRSRLWYLRRADGDDDDAVNSAIRTFWDRLHNGEKRPKDRRDPLPKTEEDVLRLLFKHLRRKIRASRLEETLLSRSAKRSADAKSLEAADLFFDKFVTTGELSEADMDTFFVAALRPIDGFPEESRELATLLLKGYSPKEISELTEKPIHIVYASIVSLKQRMEDLGLKPKR